MDQTKDNLDEALIAAWKVAASDLGFRLQAPYRLHTSTGDSIWVEGFLPDFGGSRGMVFRGMKQGTPSTDLYVSLLSSDYQQYERERFIEALIDWGWEGPMNGQPDWLFSSDR